MPDVPLIAVSGWVVETFGGADLNRAFLLVSFLPLPFWVLLIGFPDARITRALSHPLFVPSLLSPVWFFLVYVLFDTTGLPPLADFGFRSMKGFASHPIVFLVVWAHLQIFNLFTGMVIYREARRHGLRPSFELLLCWILGPCGLLAFALRAGIKKTFS